MKVIENSHYKEPIDIHENDDEPIVIHKIKNSKSITLILLIHGVMGHRYGYWGNLPDFLLKDFPDSDVGLFYYKTAWRRVGWHRTIDIYGEAKVLADLLRELRPYKRVFLIAHSMGGLLAKAAIAELIVKKRKYTLPFLSGLFLMACPQLGSLRTWSIFKYISRDARSLYPHNDALANTSEIISNRVCPYRFQRNHDAYHIPMYAVIAAEDFWVDPLSAGISIPDDQKMTVRSGHGGIVNPKTRNSDSYSFVSHKIEERFSTIYDRNYNNVDFLCTDATVREIEIIQTIAFQYLGVDITPSDKILEFIKVGSIITVVKHVINIGPGEVNEKISGYFFNIPVSELTAFALMSGAMKGSELCVSHLPADLGGQNICT